MRRWALLAAGLLWGSSLPAPAEEPGPDRLRHSDVVLSWGGFSPEVCRKYGATVWGWGTSYDSKRITEARAAGIRVVAANTNLCIRGNHKSEVGRDHFYNPRLRDSTCVDIAGDPIVVPWYALEYGDDNRAYWHCTNNRWHREHLKRVVRSGVLAGADVINVDDAMANAMVIRLPETGGCFCDACMTGFRAWMRLRFDTSALAARGIDEIDRFDYRAMVRPKFPTRADYTGAYARSEIPLQEEFRLFQTQAAANLLTELAQCARETAGQAIPLSANLGVMRPDVLLGAAVLDHFIIELPFWKYEGHFPLESLKIAEALEKKCAVWPVGYDVDRVRREGASGMLKLWIATTYALGHNFMVPARMWCSAGPTGSVFYDPPEEELVPLYRFVRETADLFDGFEPLAQFGLLYSNRDARRGRRAGEQVAYELFTRNLSYRLLLGGDDYLASRLDLAAGTDVDLVVIPDPETVAALDAEQRQVVEQWLASGRAAYWSDLAPNPPTGAVRVLGQEGVVALPRQRLTGGRRQIVVHLIDRNYQAGTNSFGLLPAIDVELAHAVLGSQVPVRATLHGPSAPAAGLAMTLDPHQIRVRVQMTGIWNVLLIE